MAALNVAPQIFYNGAWVTVPALPEDAPITIERGYTDEGTIRPSKLSMRVNDSAAPSLSPSNPTSPLYGVTGRSLPTAVGVQSSVRAWLESANMEPDQDLGFLEGSRARRWLDIEAQGPLFRIGQWSDSIDSTMYRSFSQYGTLIGYWPGEEPATAAKLSTTVGLGAATVNVTLGEATAPPGAAGSFKTATTSAIVLSPLVASTTAGFQVFWSAKLNAAAPATAQTLFSWRANQLLFSFDVDSALWRFRVYGSGGVLLSDVAYTYGGSTLPTNWNAFRGKCYQSGANVVAEVAWYSVEGGGPWGFTQNTVATIDRLTSIRINGGTMIDQAHYDHIGAVTTVADDLQSAAALASFTGFTGETAANRFLRLLSEAGITRSVIGTAATSEPMGPQKPDTLMALLRECAATEDGLIFDKRDGIELVFRTRKSRYNQTPALALNYPADISPPLKERIDNTGVQNYITLDNRSGETVISQQLTGPMSVAAYPTGIGVYKGGAYPDVKVNTSAPDTRLQLIADWYRYRGTVPAARFPTITLEVGLDTPSLQAACKLLEIGDRITVTGRTPEVIDLQVIGISEKVGIYTWTFTLTCIAGDAFNVGSEDDTTYRLAAQASTVRTPGVTTTATALPVGSANADDVWSTTSLPYPILVAGERMTVTAATAPALVSGVWQQTLTVTRSVNGVVKAQVTGATVQVAKPYREAW